MENLIGRKMLCTNSFRGITRGKKYEIVKCNEETFTIVEDNGCEQPWSREHLATEVHLKLTLDEWQPKQGDKVLVSNNKSYWAEGEFITEYKNEFIVKFNDEIIGIKYIKPYKEEIKVGDWVFLNDEKGVCKITDKHDLKEVNNKFTLVKNPELIKLLNKEL